MAQLRLCVRQKEDVLHQGHGLVHAPQAHLHWRRRRVAKHWGRSRRRRASAAGASALALALALASSCRCCAAATARGLAVSSRAGPSPTTTTATATAGRMGCRRRRRFADWQKAKAEGRSVALGHTSKRHLAHRHHAPLAPLA